MPVEVFLPFVNQNHIKSGDCGATGGFCFRSQHEFGQDDLAFAQQGPVTFRDVVVVKLTIVILIPEREREPEGAIGEDIAKMWQLLLDAVGTTDDDLIQWAKIPLIVVRVCFFVYLVEKMERKAKIFAEVAGWLGSKYG